MTEMGGQYHRNIHGFINYFHFYYKSKFNRIINDIENSDSKIYKKYNFEAILYQVISILVIMGALIYRFS